MQTLIVNMFGGPGVGKSTNSSLLFGKLKNMGINAEYVHEYAKDLVWEGRDDALSFQPYVTAKQMWWQYRLLGKVDVIITDSPLLLGIVYGGKFTNSTFDKYVMECFHQFNNLNIVLSRNSQNHKWNPKGRKQNEEEAKTVDRKIQYLLDAYGIPWEAIPVWTGEQTANYLVNLVLKRLE